MSVTTLLQYAFEKFDANEYDDAVKAFMAAYIASDDSQEKSDIFGVLSENFIEPNRQEFMNAYASNIELLKQKKCLVKIQLPKYEELPLEMIPVSDEQYYIWDSNIKTFWGSESIIVKSGNISGKKLFDSIIIDGFSDMRSILTEIIDNEYAQVYFVIEDKKTLIRFFSFFVIPNLAVIIKENMHIFQSRDDFFTFLDKTGNYIPKTIKINSDYDYLMLMNELHRKRLSEPKKNKPFVAIAIPTWNRGKKMLENLKRLQQLVFDEEIEFVISNNSSTKETEYYDEIEKLAYNDSRISYRILPSDAYDDSFTNVISNINAEYAIFCSDEDYLFPEKLFDAIQNIYENRKMGVICFGTIVGTMGYYIFGESKNYYPGASGMQIGLGCNYITGLCLDMKYIRSENLINRFVADLRGNNQYYKFYTHSVYTAYLGLHRGIHLSELPLFFDSNKTVIKEKNVDGKFRLEYIFLERRIEQTEDQIKLLCYFNVRDDVMMDGVFYAFNRLFELTRIGYGHYYQEMTERHSWKENCDLILVFFDKTMVRLNQLGIFNQNAIDILRANFIALYNKEVAKEPIIFEISD